MTSQQQIERQLDDIMVRYLKAGQEERARLVVARLRLQRQLEQLLQQRRAM
jgi:hypothetical protein